MHSELIEKAHKLVPLKCASAKIPLVRLVDVVVMERVGRRNTSSNDYDVVFTSNAEYKYNNIVHETAVVELPLFEFNQLPDCIGAIVRPFSTTHERSDSKRMIFMECLLL